MENWNSETIRDFRTSQGWSQAELAEKVGVSQNMIWYWESGKKNPWVDSILRLDDLEKSVGRYNEVSVGPTAVGPAVGPIAKNLTDVRKRLGLSQREFATIVGVSQKTIWYWESGQSKPSSDHVERLTTLFQSEGVVKGSQGGSQTGSQERVVKGSQIDGEVSHNVDIERLTNVEKNLTESLTKSLTNVEKNLTERLTDGEKSLTESLTADTKNLTKEYVSSTSEWKKYDDRPLSVIAQDMLDWCLARGYQQLGETDKEYRVQCPNMNCPSRSKSETHKAFDINKNTANFHCFHCGLSGQGLHGSRGLLAQLESGAFSPSALRASLHTDADWDFFKPKEKAQPVMTKDELPSIAQSLCKEAKVYFTNRGIPEYVYRETDARIFSAPKGTQFKFMKQPLQDFAIFFPVFSEDGEVIHVHYKLIHGGYYMSPGVKPIYLTKPTALSPIVVVEGIFDALSVYTAGYRGAALLGHEITENHELSVFEGKQVVLMLDNDVLRSKVDALATALASVASEIKIAEIPTEIDGHKIKDPNDVLVKAGLLTLGELIKNAKVYSAGNVAIACDAKPTPSAENSPDEATVSGEAPEPTLSNSGVKTANTTTVPSMKAEPPTVSMEEDKPKRKSGIVFPQEAWRGILETYRQAQEGTTEAPEQYHFGVIKTVAGIVVGRTAYVWNGRKLFPNFYTVLLGPTTQSRKSTAASRGTSLLSDIDEEISEAVGADPLVLTLRGLSTPAGLLAQLKGQNADDEGLSKTEIKRALSTSPCEGYRALIVINEFASLLRQAKKEHGSGIIQLLTDAYDCLPALHNPTKVDPTVAKNAVISMICLSTREWLENTLDLADVYGGYVCRNLFYDWTPTAPIPDPDEPNQSLLNEVTMKLQLIRRAYEDRGKQQLMYHFSVEAKPILEKWYIERWDRKHPSEVIAAATQRIDENVRKLALLYAVLENDAGDLTIHADQLQTAITVGEYWESTAMQLFSKFGFSKEVRNEIRLIEALSGGALTKQDLHKLTGNALTAKQLDNIIRSLVSIGRARWTSENFTDTLGRVRTRRVLVLNEER